MIKKLTLTRNNYFGQFRYNGFFGLCGDFAEKYFGIRPTRRRISVTISDKPIKSGGGKRMYWKGRYAAFRLEDANPENGHFMYDNAVAVLHEAFPLTPACPTEPKKFYLKIV